MTIITDGDTAWFWEKIEQVSGSRDRLRGMLQQFTRDEIYKFQDVFGELTTELQDEPYSLYLGPDESEDGLEDIANWVVSQGKARYEYVLAEPSLMPPHVDVDDPANLSYVAYEVYHDRFGEPLNVV